MRSILIDLIIEIHFKFNFTDETLSLTVLIIDKYLSKNQVQKKYFQLLGITALLIACKHEEIDVPKIDVFIYITDNAYIKSEVLEMEYKILSFLNFNLLYPSTIKFYEYLSLYFNFDKKMFFLGKYFMESFLLDIKVNKYKPATISCASCYVVMKFFKKNNYKDSYMKKFFLVDNDKENNIEYNVKECAKDICLLVNYITKCNYVSCYKKYAKPEFEKVSIIISE
jgi:cyclin B